jgi:hypothetical protein
LYAFPLPLMAAVFSCRCLPAPRYDIDDNGKRRTDSQYLSSKPNLPA